MLIAPCVYPWRCIIAAQVFPAREPRSQVSVTPSIAEAVESPASREEQAKQRERIESARLFSIDAARLAAATHCNNIVVLDVSAISPITDFLVIATGTSPRQMRSVCDEIEEFGGPRGFKSMSRPGYEGDHWILIDFMDVVVHLFNAEARAFYDLENLWGDGRKIEWAKTAG